VGGFTSYNLHAPHQLWRITDLENPLPLVFWAYWFWNLYHFGMQSFGIARLLGLPGPRWLHKIAFAGGTVAVLIAGPYVMSPLWVLLVCTVLISGGHWISEIVLTARVIGWRWWFVLGVMCVGFVGFAWAEPKAQGIATQATGLTLVLYSARIGFGFAHFLYDRWIWRLSDPEIRSALAI
jgi:hypothetical protein